MSNLLTGTGRSVIDWPTGVSVHDQQRASDSYILLTPFHSRLTYLLDRSGEVVHAWDVPATIHAKYLPGGRLLIQPSKLGIEAWDYESVTGQSGENLWMAEIDWRSDRTWSYYLGEDPDDPHNARDTIGWDSRYRPIAAHHDFQRLPNGNTLILCAAWVKNPEISDHELIDDYFLEVTPEGEAVWSWHSEQHYDEFGFSAETRRLIREAPGVHMGTSLGDYLHTNTLEVLGDNELGAKDDRFRAGNILSCQRNTNTIFIVDRATGEVVWKWGRDFLVGPHNPNMLPNGNIIVYDNGGLGGYPRRSRFFTRLVEIRPDTGEVVWTYQHDPYRFYHHKFFSVSWGSVERLPNGNTLSLDSNRGRLFEITPGGDIVWEYVNGLRGMFSWGRGERKQTRIETGVYRTYSVDPSEVPDFTDDFAYGADSEATVLVHPDLA